jgi:bifunctional DNA-binding transcriptional regulator/antitoxin component of YhaV-PrlF toxin-antitoxin module
MSDGWTLLQPNRKTYKAPELAVMHDRCLMNTTARRMLGLKEGDHIELAVKKNGDVSLRKARPNVRPTIYVRKNGEIGALHTWVRDHGFATDDYTLELRDGVLYCQLRKAERAPEMGVTNPS